jgi:hypothetical protein
MSEIERDRSEIGDHMNENVTLKQTIYIETLRFIGKRRVQRSFYDDKKAGSRDLHRYVTEEK